MCNKNENKRSCAWPNLSPRGSKGQLTSTGGALNAAETNNTDTSAVAFPALTVSSTSSVSKDAVQRPPLALLRPLRSHEGREYATAIRDATRGAKPFWVHRVNDLTV